MMVSFFGDPANFPFSVALAIVSILAIIEGVGLLIGSGVFNFLDALLPDIDVDMEIDGPDLSTPTITGEVLSWLRIGKVPIILSLIVFLVAFGLSGIFIQHSVSSLFGSPLPVSIAVFPAFLVSLPSMSVGNSLMARLMPKVETSAVSENSLLGRMAEITTGQARSRYPAQAKVLDEHNQTHYVMLEPDIETETFAQGEAVLLVRRENGTFFAIRSTSAAMTDTTVKGENK